GRGRGRLAPGWPARGGREGGLNPIRPHLVGLPIQRSVFGELYRAGELVGLASALPDGRFGAWLDDEGSLFLDRSHVDVLEPGFPLAALEAEGDRLPPPLPSPSPGARLSRGLLDLYLRCLDHGFGPERLEQEWPAVPAEVNDEVCAFCEHQTGFGPVAWESPG